MFKSVSIKNFRSIADLNVEDMRRVNVVVGGNNSGKTSLLEAMFLLSGMSQIQLAVTVHNFRGMVVENDRDFLCLFNRFLIDNSIFLQAQTDKGERTLYIEPLFQTDFFAASRQSEDSVFGSNSGEGNIQVIPENTGISGIRYRFKENENEHTLTMSYRLRKAESAKEYTEKVLCHFLNEKTIMGGGLDKKVERLVVEKRIDRIVTVLQKIEPAITAVSLGASGMIYVDTGGSKLMPLNVMGDGIRRMLSILVTISNAENGAVLVDELENGFHIGSMSVLWKAILDACKEYNVQLVATTHSYECIEALSAECDGADEQSDNVRLFRIERQENGTHRVFKYSKDLIEGSVENGIEVR